MAVNGPEARRPPGFFTSTPHFAHAKDFFYFELDVLFAFSAVPASLLPLLPLCVGLCIPCARVSSALFNFATRAYSFSESVSFAANSQSVRQSRSSSLLVMGILRHVPCHFAAKFSVRKTRKTKAVMKQ